MNQAVLSIRNPDDGHDQTFRDPDRGGCIGCIFGCAVIR